MLVMNALDEDQRVRACGNIFFFKAREIKSIANPSIGWSIVNTKGEKGFVELPEELTHLAHLRAGETIESRASAEELAIVEAKRKEGVTNYVNDLKKLVANAQISLARDLAQKNYKHDPRTEYSEGDIANMEALIKYQQKDADNGKIIADKAKELEKKLESIKLR